MSPAAGTTRYVSCTLCEAMCGLEATVGADGKVQTLRGHEGDPLSRGHLCPKAFALPQIQEDPDRLRRPLVRGADGELHEATWDDAVARAVDLIAGVQEVHGDDALAVYLGNPNVHSLGALTHHPTLVRLLRTRNRYSATSVDQLPHHVVAHALYGHQFLLPVPDVDRTDLLVLVGHNPMASNGSLWTVPDFPQRRRELAARGGRLVVLDPRRTETAAVADEHHFVRPGTDAMVLLALVREVVALGPRPAAYVDGLDAVREAVVPFTPELAERMSGMSATAVRALARALLETPSAAVHGRMGVSTQGFGVVCQWAVQTLNILTGNLDAPGGTMLTTPAVDLVGRGILGRGGFSRRRTRVRGLPGFGGELPVAALAEEMTTPGDGQVRALLTIAGNPVSSTPGGARLDAAVAGLDAYVAVDMYLNETTRHADVVLPPTGPLERDHYDLVFHVLAVRDTARFTPAPYPKDPGGRHDWEIARDLGLAYLRRRRAGGWRERVTRAGLEVEARLRTSPTTQLDALLRTGGAGLSVKKLRDAGPGGLELGALRPRLPGRLFTDDRRVDLAVPFVLDDLERVLAAASRTRDPDTLVLVGRRHQRDNNSWLHNAPVLTTGRPRHTLHANPDDLAVRGIRDGDRVRLASAAGTVEVEVCATEDVMRGVVSLPHGYGHDRDGVRLSHATGLPGASVNDVTDPDVVEAVSGNAVLNGVPVTIEPAY
ncbi:molybdopterin-dependent oxidoreductase [Phycicoccus sp. CSK15P-2]|uniref:molybdopterin-dependent oxidoreductase n=1 Tax=Phycicoccus sp. CSK15P-2 TaxID=2807627 RepID=UPI00195048EE|nr:molybdopterin-dependent oxidoreductase [Phycicoccus sp. CSK15P-2]MBM6405367.1 molybdopterin-dependent oxidoreductase [Phycicoccus sp. CSK15P-2]